MEEFDHDIIMHRDVHFGGLFDEMLSYYNNEENLGIQHDFAKKRIQELATYEKSAEKNLHSLLTKEEKEQVTFFKNAYKELRSIYEIDDPKSQLPRLMADLILAEKDEVDDAIKKVVNQGEKIVPDLISLLKKDEAFEPLFPGYGLAPLHAIAALGQLQDKRSIIPLFEAIGRENVFNEDAILTALSKQGDEARHFLLKVLKSRPITQDNIHAALALSDFDHPDVLMTASKEIQDKNTWKIPFFFTYLLSLCQQDKDLLQNLANDPTLPKSLKKEIEQSLRK